VLNKSLYNESSDQEIILPKKVNTKSNRKRSVSIDKSVDMSRDGISEKSQESELPV